MTQQRPPIAQCAVEARPEPATRGIDAGHVTPIDGRITVETPILPAVHLVTILYNSEDGLAIFLDSLQAQDIPAWKLIVIDNASPDGSRDLVMARNDPRMIMVRNVTNLGFSKAANQGLRAAMTDGGELLVLINNDTQFEPDFLRRLVAIWQNHKQSVVAPRVMMQEQPGKSWYAGGRLEYGWAFINIHDEYDPDGSQVPTQVEFAPGCCLAFGRAVIEKAGLFDESFFVYWEDTDFCLRLKTIGIPIMYIPELSLLHVGGASSGGEFSRSYMRLYYRSYMQILRKHFGLPHALRTMLRLLLREKNRPNRKPATIRTMARAMLLGMVAPLVKDPRYEGRHDAVGDSLVGHK